MFSSRSINSARSMVMSAAGCIALTLLAVATAAAAPPPPQQIVRYNVGVDDRATSIVTDAAGNFYVAGYTQRSNRVQTFTVVKHDPQGGVVWSTQYSGASGGDGISLARSLALGPDGSVYATGYSSIVQDIFVSYSEFLTVKFSPSGVEQWSVRRNAQGYGSSASKILVDAAGNAYVSGNAYSQGYDWLTIKYSPSGAVLWQRTLTGAGTFNDTVTDSAFDSDGNVVVAGNTQNRGDGETSDITTVKYDPQGNVVWRADFSETGISHELAADLDTDANGNVYVTGTSADDVSPYTISTPRTLVYNRGGGLVLTLRDTAAGGTAVDVDASGNIYVAGFFSPDINTPPTGSVARFDPLGNRVWVAPVPFGAILIRLAVAADGGLYGAGGGGDYLTVRFDATGGLTWQSVYNGTGNRDDNVADLALDGAGNVLVTGSSWGNYTSIGGTGHDFVTLKFSNGGSTPGNPGNQQLQAPASTRAVAVTGRLVNVDWQDASSAESGFRIERCQGSRCTNFAQVGQVGPNATTFSDDTVVRNTTYRYRVRAFSASAESPNSNVAMTTTPRR